MKKKIKIIVIVVIILVLLVLFVPIPEDVNGHGETKVYSAVTYRIVKWDKPLDYAKEESCNYKKTKVYFLADRYKSLKKLWYEELKSIEYTDEWIVKDFAKYSEEEYIYPCTIEAVYSNCYFLKCSSSVFKINDQLPDEWCLGDEAAFTIKREYSLYDKEERMHRVEGKVTKIEVYEAERFMDKPVLYLYPEEETEVSVKLDVEGELTCTYPKYNDGWKVTAKADGTLKDEKGLEYNYLYWEAKSDVEFDMSKGFCIKGEDTAAFLEEALKKLGLNRKEANEFIIYWLPMMEGNPYNIISFQTDTYTDMAKLDIDPVPDTLIRVFMAWSPTEEYVEVEEQELSAPERQGFCVVEWGGSKVE